MCLTAYLSESAGIVETLFVLLIVCIPQHVSASMQGRHSVGICPDSRKLVCGAQYLAHPLAYDYAGSHGIAGYHAWHDGPIRDTKVFDSIDLKPGIDDRHGIAPHFCGACLVMVSSSRIADEVFQGGSFQATRHDFTFCVRSKWN
jgi:hypothetical protein